MNKFSNLFLELCQRDREGERGSLWEYLRDKEILELVLTERVNARLMKISGIIFVSLRLKLEAEKRARNAQKRFLRAVKRNSTDLCKTYM